MRIIGRNQKNVKYLILIFFCRHGLPFFITTLMFSINIPVGSSGILCSATLVIMILLIITLLMACAKGKLSRIIGVVFLVIYVLFIVISIGFTYNFFQCPI